MPFRPLLLAAIFTVGIHRSAQADPILQLVGGDPVAIQFGSATPSMTMPFSLWSGFLPSPIPLLFSYSALPFVAASGGQSIEISRYGFTNNYTSLMYAIGATNVYDVFMSV